MRQSPVLVHAPVVRFQSGKAAWDGVHPSCEVPVLAARVRPILVVDDQADSREMLAEYLSSAGYPVVQAANGEQALHHIVSNQADTPCLIILDLDMPVMSGWEFLAIARQYRRLSQIPVVISSGSQEHLEAFQHDAVAACFQKPVDLEALLDKVKQLDDCAPSVD